MLESQIAPRRLYDRFPCIFICFCVFAASQVLPVYQDVVQLLLCTSGCPRCNLFPRCFLFIVLSATNMCNISHCFNQTPLLFDSLRVCGRTLRRSIPIPGPRSALKSPPTICMFFVDFVIFSTELYALGTRIWSMNLLYRSYRHHF